VPVTVTICEVTREPTRFDHKIVTIRSSILIGFESFQIDAAKCDGRLIDSVWLEYGRGPKRQPTTWCCGDMAPRDSLRLVQNSEFRRFHSLLTAQYRIPGCYEGQCYRYRVTASLTGRFDATKTHICPDGRSHCCENGFGHFGLSCGRLVILSVSDVAAHPTDRVVYEKKK
jgi:hypothetical protein